MHIFFTQAIRDGNKIWAVVRTGTNQDGHSVQPISAPSSELQEQLLQNIFSTSSVDPASIQYIEAHGML